MKKSLLIAFGIAISALFSCKKNSNDEVPPVKIQRMKTLLSNQWKLTGYYYEDSVHTGSFPMILTLDYFAFTECLRNSAVKFTPDEKGTITSTCYNPVITARWHFSEDSTRFKYKWSTLNIRTDSVFQFMYFTADSIALMQKSTRTTNETHYEKYVLQLKKQ
jgi:hypothetical protein